MRSRPAAALLVLGLIGGGCGGSDLDRIAGAPDAVHEQGTARFEITIESSLGEGEGFTSTTRAEGAVDFAAERGEMTMEIDFPSELLDGVELQPCRMIFEGTSIYLAVPDHAGFEGRPWVRADATDLAGFQVTSFGTADPTAPLEFLRGASRVEETEREVVRGTPTAGYRGLVDRERILDRVDPDRREQLATQLERLAVAEIPFEVRLDAEDLVRWMELRIEDGSARTVMTMELFDFGAPVGTESPQDDAHEAPDAAAVQAATGACIGFPTPEPETAP